MAEKVRISFDGSLEDYTSPMVVIYNPLVLSPELLSQVKRFGLASRGGRSSLSGRLRGTGRDFMRMIESYGVGIQIVNAA